MERGPGSIPGRGFGSTTRSSSFPVLDCSNNGDWGPCKGERGTLVTIHERCQKSYAVGRAHGIDKMKRAYYRSLFAEIARRKAEDEAERLREENERLTALLLALA
jgi:hypothetical protein